MAAYVFYATLFLVLLFDVFIFRLRVIGRGHRASRSGAFLVSNHSLYFDPGWWPTPSPAHHVLGPGEHRASYPVPGQLHPASWAPSPSRSA
jgi:1-acyl-sn-glycerol-3-phosphate acyltransferase